MKTKLITIRGDALAIDHAKASGNASRAFISAYVFTHPESLNHPVIEYTKEYRGWLATGPDFCGDPESKCIFGTGHTKEAAKEDYLSQWREQQ